MTNQREPVVIIGAGPAGLTAAYELTKHGISPIVLEQSGGVGGIARTESYKGYFFDMGGHRFYTKSKPVQEFWRELLGDDFLRRPRLSRIYYKNRFFHYPLKPMNALFGLGISQAVLVILSYVRWQFFPHKREDTFEQWVTNRFGKRLYQIFFKSYTEKVWGVPCSELKAEWAAQRIKDLSLTTALLSMFMMPRKPIDTLIGEFHYPRQGPGMLWSKVKDEVERRNGTVCLNSKVVRISREGNRIASVVVSGDGHPDEVIRGSAYISSMPVSEFVQKLDPVPEDVLAAARKLKYRDFLTVCLIINRRDLFPDNWIYIHAPEVRVGRIQNFKNWSPDMVPDLSRTSLGLEYFCSEGDEIWTMSDAALIELGKKELERIGLARYADVEDGCVFRVPNAYPIYDADYTSYLSIVRRFVDGLENFQTVGRNGLHRYNNQDHSMLTAMYAVRNLALGEQNDLWRVNTEQEYHEHVYRPETEPVPSPASEPAASLGLPELVFTRLDPLAFGVSVGVTAGILLLLATLFLIIKDGSVAGPGLLLLAQYFPGYTITLTGGLVGFAYAFVTGFLAGWGFAYLRNLALYVSVRAIHRDIESHLLRRFLDYN
jgi:protoporphyrinogen oxidase